MAQYLYLFETFDTPAEHINPAGDVVGTLIRELKDSIDEEVISCTPAYDAFDGESCCKGYNVPDDIECDGLISEDSDRTMLHDPNAWEGFSPDIIEEYYYTAIDVEIA